MNDPSYIRSYGKPVMMGHNLYFNSQSYYVNTNGAASFSSIAAPTATISNATISGDLVVNGVIHGNEFIKNIVKAVGGQLYVSPTFQATSSTTISCTSADASYVYLTLQDNGITSSEYAGATWYSGSKIMLSGTLTANTTGHTEEIIFSSAPGELTAQMNSGTNGAKKLQIKVEYNNANTYFKSGSLIFSDVAVMMYQINNSGNLYPIGIYIKAYGTDNQKSYIDIFGGSSTSPNARLGLLTGLGNMPSGSTIQGWGIYTDNGFYKGIVEANGGLIGNWTIGTTGMYYNSDAPGSTSITMIPGGTAASTTSIGGSSGSKSWIFTGKNLFGIDTTGKLYASSAVISGDITANTGYIGGTSGWTIASQQLSNGTLGADNSFYLGTKNLGSNTSIAGRKGSDWRLTVGSCFGVTNTGAIYATSGGIGGWTINGNYLYTGTWGTSNSAMLCTGSSAAKSIGGSGSISGWVFTADSKFGVTKSGSLYASSAHITGEITATSGSLAAGVIIGDANGYHAVMDSNSFDVFNGSNQLATFGQDTTIGDMSTRGVSIDENGFKFNNDGSQAFHIGIDSRTTDSIASSNGTTITNQVSKITVNNVVYYQLCAIDSTTDIVNVTSQGAINLDDPDYIKTGIWLTDGGTINLTWVIDSGYLWVHSPDYEKYTNFRDTVYYEYLVSTTTNSSPYCVIGASAYTEYEVAGFMSLSQGYLNKATGAFSTALGNGTEAQGSCSFACGKGSSANGEQSIAMMNSEVWGSYSIGIGRENAIYSHRSCSIGYENCIETIDTATATNNYAFGMRNDIGYITQYPKLSTTHDASNCFAIGVANTVGGEGGIYTTMAIGFNNIAMEDSFAIGSRLVSSSGLVVGKYNQYTSQYSATDKITYYNSGNYAFVIGNGTSDGARSNAFTVDWNGTVEVNGNLNATGNVIAKNTSHIGMVVMSTTLNTMAKVIAIYGGTTWIQHSGYFLYGATSGVTANSATSDGGEASVTLTSAQSGLPAHSHPPSNSTQRFQMRPNDSTSADSGAQISGSGYYFPRSEITGWGSANATGNNTAQSAAEAHNNMPPYKNVYIWERTA